MTPKEKAIELVEKYKAYVHGYVGSSMLTNYEYPEQILSQAKKVATITVDEVVFALSMCYSEDVIINYWEEVRKELSKM